jgi:glycosyltransferase involved in cell wall biosynthesis
MRVLFLTKQQYMAKDLLQDRFGRFYEIPRVLSRWGHKVCGVCLKYRRNKNKWEVSVSDTCDQVEWNSFSLGRNWPLGFIRHYRRLQRVTAMFQPDVIIGASDTAHVVVSSWLASKFGIPFVVDLYDNFESYGATQLPGMKRLLRRAVGSAAAVSVVSETLRLKVEAEYQPTGIVRTITNAIAPEVFYPDDKAAARRRLGLPESQTLIGTAGSLNRKRGIDILYRAFEQLSKRKKDWSLVLAGPIDRRANFPIGSKIFYLGELSHDRVRDLFNALDVGVICNRDDAFGRYCFPQKLFEMIACGLPIVAADVGAMRSLIPDSECALFDPGNVESLANAISVQSKNRYISSMAIPTWHDCGLKFGNLLEAAVAANTRSSYGVEAAHLSAGEL